LCFRIDIKFRFKDLDFEFKADTELGKPYNFDIGEPVLADKLFGVLAGLDLDFSGTINGNGVCFNASERNNVLALGDNSMFIKGSVRKNIYKTLRIRTDRKTAKQRTEEVIRLYNLENSADLNINRLNGDELLKVSLARAHFREVRLVIIKNYPAIDLSKWRQAYIITIS
jgi:ABC-type taurine transport system ATPase subunit